MEIPISEFRKLLREGPQKDFPEEIRKKLIQNHVSIEYLDRRLIIQIRDSQFETITVQLEELTTTASSSSNDYIGYVIDEHSISYINQFLNPGEQNNLQFSYCVFACNIGSQQAVYGSFGLHSCIFENNASFIESHISEVCSIKGCIFKKELNLSSTRFMDGFVFRDNAV